MVGYSSNSILFCHVLLLVCVSTAFATAPNIVFMVADDLGWNDVGWNNPRIETPNLDRMAREGVILNSSYVQPVCSPSRSAFMTGYYPFHSGLQHHVIMANYAYGVPLNQTFLPEKLKALGYDTHIIGKWHLGFCHWNYTPTYRGFDSFYGFYTGGLHYYKHRRGGNLDFRFNKAPLRDHKGVYSTRVFANRARDVIEQHNASKPLFIYLPFQSVHDPLQVPKRYEIKYKEITNKARRVRLGMVTAMDEAIGHVTESLKRKGILNNTLIVFISDNGGPVGSQGNNWPLRGGKGSVFEGGTRVPTLVWGNMLRKKEYTNSRMIHAVDWFPTFLELAGGTPDPGIDGVSQWATLNEDEASARTEFVYNIDELDGMAAIRSGDYKYLEGNFPGPHYWVPPVENKNITAPERPPRQRRYLFNIAEDPTESNDLSRELPGVVRTMKMKVKKYLETLHPAFPPVPDPKWNPRRFGRVVSPGWCKV